MVYGARFYTGDAFPSLLDNRGPELFDYVEFGASFFFVFVVLSCFCCVDPDKSRNVKAHVNLESLMLL